MRFAVVGSGFTGLACAIELARSGHVVELYEKSNEVGGLASGFKSKKWKWSLEYFYHHFFTNDRDIINAAKRAGTKYTIKQPTSSSFIDGEIVELDSPVSVLKFKNLSLLNRLRMGMGLLFLKLIRRGSFLEKYRVSELLPKLIGQSAYQTVWEKLLKAKFGRFVGRVNMAWFWSRIVKRTRKLGYLEGGFAQLALDMLDQYNKLGGVFYIESEFDFRKNNLENYDRVIVTTPAPVAEKITKLNVMPKIDYLWAQTLILELNRSLMPCYWLNVLEKKWPFLVVVEHTNFIDKSNYDDNIIVYFGNYLTGDNKQLKMNKDQILDLYSEYINKINSEFSKDWIKSSYLFRANFAQPVFPINYSHQIEKINKKDRKVWFANMSMVYPYDRGTNYAIEIGRRVARECLL